MKLRLALIVALWALPVVAQMHLYGPVQIHGALVGGNVVSNGQDSVTFNNLHLNGQVRMGGDAVSFGVGSGGTNLEFFNPVAAPLFIGSALGLYSFPAITNLHGVGDVVLGAGDGATPTATRVRGPAAAGTNVAGADLTIDASTGTGTGNSGSIILRTAAGATNALSIGAHSRVVSGTSFAHTTAAGDGRLLMVQFTAVAGGGATLGAFTSVTYNEVPMTTVYAVNDGGYVMGIVAYLVNPPVGTYTVAAHYTGTYDNMGGTAVSFTGADQSAPLRTAETATANFANGPWSFNVESQVGDFVTGWNLLRDANVITVTDTQATVDHEDGTSWQNLNWLITSKAGAAGSTSLSYSGYRYAWIHLGVAVKPMTLTSPNVLAASLSVAPDGSVTVRSNVTAAKFVGDGSLLTGLPDVTATNVTAGITNQWKLDAAAAALTATNDLNTVLRGVMQNSTNDLGTAARSNAASFQPASANLSQWAGLSTNAPVGISIAGNAATASAGWPTTWAGSAITAGTIAQVTGATNDLNTAIVTRGYLTGTSNAVTATTASNVVAGVTNQWLLDFTNRLKGAYFTPYVVTPTGTTNVLISPDNGNYQSITLGASAYISVVSGNSNSSQVVTLDLEPGANAVTFAISNLISSFTTYTPSNGSVNTLLFVKPYGANKTNWFIKQLN